MTSKPRRKRNSELLRGRFRTLFFLTLAVVCFVAGHRFVLGPAAAGVLAGLWSMKIARRRRRALAYTFAVVDWLFLGLAVVLTGGMHSWLLLAIPLLASGQLLVSRRADWPYLLAPALLLVIEVAIADPTLAQARAFSLAKLFVLVASGALAAHELRRSHRVRPARVTSVDAASGFYTATRLEQAVSAAMETALSRHDALGIVCLRLDHFRDTQSFLGPERSEALVQAVARRVKRHLLTDDLTFRLADDTFVLALAGRSPQETRQEAAAICHDISAHLIDRRRQTLSWGTASFPTIRTLEGLLDEAQSGLVTQPAAAPVAIAQ
jgi:GGDEF domain-containing protein